MKEERRQTKEIEEALILQVIDLYLSISVPGTRRPGLQRGHIALFDSLAQGGQRHRARHCAMCLFVCPLATALRMFTVRAQSRCAHNWQGLSVYGRVSLDVQGDKLNFI